MFMLGCHLLLGTNVASYPLPQCINHIRPSSGGGFHGFNHVHGSWSSTKFTDEELSLALVSVESNISLCHFWVTFTDCIYVSESCFKVFHKQEHSSRILEMVLLLQLRLLLVEIHHNIVTVSVGCQK